MDVHDNLLNEVFQGFPRKRMTKRETDNDFESVQDPNSASIGAARCRYKKQQQKREKTD